MPIRRIRCITMEIIRASLPGFRTVALVVKHPVKLLIACLSLALSLESVPAFSQTPAFPSKVVRIISPFPIGLSADVITRLIADKLTRALGQQVIVESRPGANGFIAIDALKKAPADGHNLLVMAENHWAVNPYLFKSLPYEPERDFVPVSLMYRTAFFVVTSATGPYQSLQGLIAAAKANPGRVTYASTGVGSSPHFGGALLAYLTKTQMTPVHFKEAAPMLTSVANGDVSFIVSVSGSSAPLVKAGKLRYLAAASPTRLDIEPDVPGAKEAGGPEDFRIHTLTGIVALRGTPIEIVRRLSAGIGNALGQPDVRERIRSLGSQATSSSSEEMAAVIRNQLSSYGELIRRIGITAE